MFLKIQAEICFELKLQLFGRVCQRLFNLQPNAVSRCVYVRVLTQRRWKKFRTLIKDYCKAGAITSRCLRLSPKKNKKTKRTKTLTVGD